MRTVFTSFVAATLLPGAAAAATCRIGPHPGVSDVDAETTAGIVCHHLRRSGVDVGDPISELDAPDGEGWRISLRPLGRKLFLTLQHFDDGGDLRGESELLLQEIEEVSVAAPRLVDAVLSRKPVEQTATVSSLVGEETRRYRKRDGETFFGLGFVGTAIPGTDVFPGAGFLFRTAFETEDFSVLADLRTAFGTSGDDDSGYFALGIGGRWFLSDGNWSPFLGLGLGWTSLAVETDSFDGSNSGMGGWVEVGVEALRFYETRLSIDLRAELPFYSLDGETGYRLDEPERDERKFYLPITLGIAYLW